ncbi:MAG TPA: hypothetical protein PK225_11995 [Azonexus sp.]|nr:hypothetical protein [Azonexus sp.]
MQTVLYITPDGVTVEVPQADAAHFDAKGWERAEEQSNATGEQQQEEVPQAGAAHNNNRNNNRNNRR